MTIDKTEAVQLSNVAIQVLWDSTVLPAAGFEVARVVNPPSATKVLAVVNGDTAVFVDDIASDGLVTGDILEYTIVDLDTPANQGVATVTLADLDVPYTFGPVIVLATAPRYTTLDDVKQRLGITHAESDDEITTAIIGAESAMDQINGRSFPDTGTNPEIPGVPQAIVTWALDASIAVWKAADAPFGQGGGDAWLGSLDITTITERVLRRHPMALGYQVSWGVA